MRFKHLLISAALCVSSAVQAAPSLAFLIDGDTFAQPFRIDNNSGGGEMVTRFALDLSTITTPGGAFCFDTVAGGPCRFTGGAGPFSPVGGTDVTTGLIGPVVVPDAAQLLDISFTDFDAGEFFSWDIDVDQIGAPNSTVTGDQMVGATATVDFNDGTRLFGVIGTVVGNPDAGQFVVTGVGRVVPEPGSLLLVGSAALALALARRRAH